MVKIDVKIVRISYCLFVLSWTIGNMTNNVNDDYKYLFMAAGVIVTLMPVIAAVKEGKTIETYGLVQMLIVGAGLAFISILAMLSNGMYMKMTKDLFYIVTPMVYVFAIINVDRHGDLEFYIDLAFFSYVFTFLYIYKKTFTLANLLSISFINSYSPWESGLADIFFIAFYYYYVRGRKGKCITAFLFNLLAFKRFHIIASVIVLLIGHRPGQLSTRTMNILKMLVIASPIVIVFINSEVFAGIFYNIAGQTLNSFTKGRFNQINFVLNLKESTFGLGMTHMYLTQYGFDIMRLHCDLLRLYLETGIVGLAVFVNGYFNMTRRNYYNVVLLMVFFVIMFTSTCIEAIFHWFIIFMCFEAINRNSGERSIRE